MRIELPDEQKIRSGRRFTAFAAAAVLFFLLFISPLWLDFSQKPSRLAVQNFLGDVQFLSPKAQEKGVARRGQMLYFSDRLQTGPGSEIDLQGSGFNIRLKENSEIEIRRAKSFFARAVDVHLLRGKLIAANPEGRLRISAGGADLSFSKGIVRGGFFLPRLSLRMKKAAMLVEASEQGLKAASLDGNVKTANEIPFAQALRPLHKAETGKQLFGPLKISRITQDEWNQLREAYEFMPKSAAQEARQLDLAKRAGNFFAHSFDHGAFYRKDYGYAEREFYTASPSGGEVRLKMLYDVFPPGSIAGVYFKFRDVEVPRFKKFIFEMRRIPGMEYPEGFQIELKYKLKTIRLYTLKEAPAEEWKKVELPLRVYGQTPITEMVFVFPHDRVGANKKGGMELRNLTLEADPLPAVPAAPPVAKAAAAPTALLIRPQLPRPESAPKTCFQPPYLCLKCPFFPECEDG